MTYTIIPWLLAGLQCTCNHAWFVIVFNRQTSRRRFRHARQCRHRNTNPCRINIKQRHIDGYSEPVDTSHHACANTRDEKDGHLVSDYRVLNKQTKTRRWEHDTIEGVCTGHFEWAWDPVAGRRARFAMQEILFRVHMAQAENDDVVFKCSLNLYDVVFWMLHVINRF